MNAITGINNIKIKKFYEKENKTVISSQDNNIKKETNSKASKKSPLLKNKYSEYQMNKTPDMKNHINPRLTHDSFFNHDEDNKFINRIILFDKRSKGALIKNDNSAYEFSGIYDKKNKTNNNFNINNFFYENKGKKVKKMNKVNNNDSLKFNYQEKNKTGILNTNINKINKKMPQDNMRNKNEGFIISRKSFDSKKNKNPNSLINENENYKMNKYSMNYNNNDNYNNNNFKIIFHNTVKKSVIETKSSGNNLKSIFSDEDIENILSLNYISSKIDKFSYSKNELSLSQREVAFQYRKSKLLYIINDEQKYIFKNKSYSTSDDYDTIIKNNLKDKIILSKELLQLPERKWYEELTSVSNELKAKREKFHLDDNFNKYLKKIIIIYEHFNWLINSLSVYYNLMFQNKKLDVNLFGEVALPGIDSPLWRRGFEWKGLYISTTLENHSKHIKNEIKSLNYFFFEYLQIIEKYRENKSNQLSNNLIFPLIAYSQINGMVLYGSVLINPDKSFNNNPNFVNKFIDEIIRHNSGYVNTFLNYNNFNNISNINSNNSSSMKVEEDEHGHKVDNMYELLGQLEKTYYLDDLFNSKLFSNLCEFHLVPICGDKFVFINVFNLIPNLFEIKFTYYKKMNFFSIINNRKTYDALLYNKKIKTYHNNNNQVYKPKEIFEKYKLNMHKPLKIKDILINNVHFRILFENYENVRKNYMTRTFVDNLINHYNDESDNMKYVGEHYLVIYDLIKPIKIKYSLIKNMNKGINKDKGNNSGSNNDLFFYLKTNYISYFLAWCKALNKNSYNIKTYAQLKESMKKFGINSHLKFFSLVNIDNTEITDIIKISLLVKLIKFIFNRKDCTLNYNNKTKYLFEDERRGRIIFIIKSFLYTNEISPGENKEFEKLFEELVFYMNVFFFKLKLIDSYLYLGLLNEKSLSEINISCAKKNLILKEDMDSLVQKISGFDSSKDFLKHIIFTARKKPFLFLSELEMKLNFVINPFIKYKASLSIESMSKKLKIEHINLNNFFDLISYVNCEEISGLILSKLIYDNDEKSKSDNDDSIISNEESIHYYECEPKKKNSGLKPNANNNKNKIKTSTLHHFIIDENDDFSETKSDNNLQQYNFQNKFGSTQKSSLPPSPMKRNSRFLERENSIVKWSDIKDNLFFKLPSLCYKMNFEYEELSGNININDANTYLKNNYKISDSKIFREYFSNIDFIFNKVYSCSGKIEQTLLHSLFYIFIVNFFVEKNNEESQKINKKIKEIYSNGSYLLSLADLSLINLFQGLSCESYLYSEEPYSKSVILLLMLYGDPRGRYNDSHALLQLPLFKIARKTLKLEREQPANNQYLSEIYKSLEFFGKDKDKLNLSKNITYFDHEKNIMKNIKNILATNNVIIRKKSESENNMSDTDFIINNYFNKNYFLSHNVFRNDMLDLYLIKNFHFSIEENSRNIQKKVYSKEFIIYLIKLIQSVLIGKNKIYDEKYINENISENVFNFNEIENKMKFFKENDSQKKYNKSSINIKADPPHQTQNEMEFSPKQLIEAFNNRKNILEFFPFKINNKKSNNNKLNNSLSSQKSDIKTQNTEIIKKVKDGNRPSFTIHKNKNQNQRNIFSHYLYNELLDKLSYRKNCPSGIVVSFGNNTHYETGHDDYKAIKYPLLIYKLKNIRVKKIYSGWEYNIIVSSTNEIYSFGNNNNLQCGIPINDKDKEDIKVKNPTNISILNNGIKAISVACGNEHTLILDEKNDVYSFGNNEDGVLGIENNKLKSYKFIKVNFGQYNNRIKAISAGTVHSIALTDDGKIFSWGSAQGGQLGLSEEYLKQFKNQYFYISTPTLIPIRENHKTKEDMKITKISCGEAHSIILNNKKEVYSWGFGSNGQLGLGFCEDSFELGTGLSKSRIFTPQKIKAFDNLEQKVLISDIQCGKTFSMFIDTKGGLYSCGVNDLKQLGIPESPPRNHLKHNDHQCKDFVIPTRLEFFLNMKVEKISCGEAHCLAIVKENHSNERIIWSWGNNRYGQLGLGDKINFSLPKPINFLLEYKENKFESVSCGGFHSLCLIESNEDINWIEDDFKHTICKIIEDIGII